MESESVVGMWVEMRSFPVSFNHGEVGLIVYCVEAIRAEECLQEKEQRSAGE